MEDGYAPRQLEAGELIMLVPRTQEAAWRIINTSAVKCESTADDTPYQSAAFYLSVLTTVFPGLLPFSREVLREIGYTVIEVTEDTAAGFAITLQPWINVPTALAIVGLFASVIYKNIDDQSYDRVMESRAAAIKNVAGVVGDLVPGEGNILLTISTAKNIRTIVGRNSRLRIGLLKIILDNRDGQSLLNLVCNHLAEIISWTDMTPVLYVFDLLCLTRSPVLRDSRVRHEVLNLYEAWRRICEKVHPQYYQILFPTEARVTIDRSRFKTLAEVARRYMIEQKNFVSQSAASADSQNTLVNELLSIHRAYMMTPIRRDDMQ